MTRSEVREELRKVTAECSANPTRANQTERDVWTFIHTEMIYCDSEELSDQRLADLKKSGRLCSEATQRQVAAMYR